MNGGEPRAWRVFFAVVGVLGLVGTGVLVYLGVHPGASFMGGSTFPPVQQSPQVQPLAEPSSSPEIGSGATFSRILSDGAAPENSAHLTVSVPEGTVHVITGGPLCVESVCLPGGEERGSVLILLPRGRPYEIGSLIPNQNWHGAYSGDPSQWMILATDRVAAMHAPANCTTEDGCKEVDVLVMGADGLVSQYSD